MTLNDLLFSIRRAHLLCHQKEKTMPEELPHKRADFIHKALKGSQLLIQE
jgi:protein arginine kinase